MSLKLRPHSSPDIIGHHNYKILESLFLGLHKISHFIHKRDGSALVTTHEKLHDAHKEVFTSKHPGVKSQLKLKKIV